MKAYAIAIAAAVLLLVGCTTGLFFSEQEISEELSHTVQQIEQKIQLPDGAFPINSYIRYYVQDDKDVVIGTYVYFGSAGRIEIVEENEIPNVLDGGCGVITFTYSLTKKTFLSLRCNGVA